MTLSQKINPLNKEEEKKKFFFDPLYNPQFIYAEQVFPEELHVYMPVSDEYLPMAEKILSFITKQFGSHEKYLEAIREPLLSREEIESLIAEYLAQENLTKSITVKYSDSAIARTSTASNVLTVRLPAEYSKHSLLGMLNHEVGTHHIRSLNDRKQIWRNKRDKFHLHPYLLTEEGLAVLHAQLARSDTMLRRQALHYVAVLFANTHSFSELNEYLKPYVPDREIRWTFCLRAKRGIKDTSQPGAFTKDQTYFVGAVQVFLWLKKHGFDPRTLYVGKIAIEDADTLSTISNKEEIILPSFIAKHSERYKEKVMKIGKDNFFDK